MPPVPAPAGARCDGAAAPAPCSVRRCRPGRAGDHGGRLAPQVTRPQSAASGRACGPLEIVSSVIAPPASSATTAAAPRPDTTAAGRTAWAATTAACGHLANLRCRLRCRPQRCTAAAEAALPPDPDAAGAALASAAAASLPAPAAVTRTLGAAVRRQSHRCSSRGPRPARRGASQNPVRMVPPRGRLRPTSQRTKARAETGGKEGKSRYISTRDTGPRSGMPAAQAAGRPHGQLSRAPGRRSFSRCRSGC